MNAKLCKLIALSYKMITDLLKMFRMRAEVYHNAKVCGDWLIQEHILGQTCFHMPTEGGCWLDVPGHLSEALKEGELVVFAREIAHSMQPLHAQSGEQRHLSYVEAAQREGTGMLCGRLEFLHAGGSALIDALPPVLIFRHGDDTLWLAQLRALLIDESYRNAQSLVIDRLAELVFSYAIRHYVEKDCCQLGVLALYGHKKLKAAAEAMHSSPSYPWTLEELASIAGLSRTLFASQFRQTCGWTVMRYLTWWRMQLAYRSLGQGDSVGQVAELVGYRSEAAFSRAFQREFSCTAGEVRRRGV